MSQEDPAALLAMQRQADAAAEAARDYEQKLQIRKSKVITTKLVGKLTHPEIYDNVKNGMTGAQKIEADLRAKDNGDDRMSSADYWPSFFATYVTSWM